MAYKTCLYILHVLQLMLIAWPVQNFDFIKWNCHYQEKGKLIIEGSFSIFKHQWFCSKQWLDQYIVSFLVRLSVNIKIVQREWGLQPKRTYFYERNYQHKFLFTLECIGITGKWWFRHNKYTRGGGYYWRLWISCFHQLLQLFDWTLARARPIQSL